MTIEEKLDKLERQNIMFLEWFQKLENDVVAIENRLETAFVWANDVECFLHWGKRENGK